MPYVEGESLRVKLAQRGELPINEAVRVLRDVVDALASAHKHGVVHRDIKPDNVLLAENHAVVTDFGVAKAVSEATGREKLTTAGVALGTPAYMAPEQAAADPHIDQRADIYAIGVLAYELLTGRPPFTGETPQSVLSAHVTQAPEPVTSHRQAVPPALAGLVMRCLEKKPADRWQSAGELLPQLEALMTPSGGVTPTQTTPVPAVTPVSRKRRVPVAVAAAVVIVAVGAVALLRPTGGPVLDADRVVVGVFENQSGDPSLDVVGTMAADWIAQGLQRAGIVDVVPAATALQASRFLEAEIGAGHVTDPVRALAEETGAGTVVAGTYYVERDSIRLQAQVTSAADGSVLGAIEPVSGSVEAAREAIEALRERVMGLLAVSLDERLAASAQGGGVAPTLEAYRAFDEGMKLYLSAEFSDAVPHLLRATALDSTFVVPLVYAGFSLSNVPGAEARSDSVLDAAIERAQWLPAYDHHMAEAMRASLKGDMGEAHRAYSSAVEVAPGSKAVYNLALVAQWLNRPREAVERLQSLDPERGAMRSWVGYWSVLCGSYHMLGEYGEELDAARRAQLQYPNEPFLLYVEARALVGLNRLDEIEEKLERLRGLQADWFGTAGGQLRNIGDELRAHGHPEMAREMFRRSVEWFETRPPAEAERTVRRYGLGQSLYRAGRYEETEAVFERLVEEHPNDVRYRGWLGFVSVKLGNEERASEIEGWLEGLSVPYLGGLHTVFRAAIAAARGERDRAVALLQDAFAQGGGYGVPWHRQPGFEVLWDYPPFQELMRPKG
jgi:serine/threonine-protein kinase